MILPAHVLGVRPTLPGFGEFEIRPHVAGLERARGVIPSPKGDIHIIHFQGADGGQGGYFNSVEGVRRHVCIAETPIGSRECGSAIRPHAEGFVRALRWCLSLGMPSKGGDDDG